MKAPSANYSPTQLRGLKKSISSLQRLYFPEFSVQSVLKHPSNLIKKFNDVNTDITKRIQKYWDKRRRIFVICDDLLIPRDAKKAHRTGYFRDPVIKKVRMGHNLVDTIVAVDGIEITIDFDFQPKGSKIPKIQRAVKQLLHALTFVDQNGTPKEKHEFAS